MTDGRARSCTAFAVVTVMLAAAEPAAAQLARTPRAYRGLFDPAAKADSVQSLTASGSLMSGYDTNVLALGRGNSFNIERTAVLGGGGYFGAASGSLGYSLDTKPVGFFARASTSGRYFPKLGTWATFQSATAGATVSSGLWSQATFQMASSASYGNSDRLHLFDQPDGTADAYFEQQDYAVVDREAIRYSVTTGLSQRLGSRTSVSVSASGRYHDNGGNASNYRKYTAGAEWQYQFTRNATAYLGYGYQQAQYSGAGLEGRRPVGQSVDGGVRYGRALSLTRKTSLSFGTGSAFVRSAPLSSESDRNPLRVHLTGSALLSHEIARSWYAHLVYTRNVRFIEEFSDPILSDLVSAGVAGYLGQRLDLSMVAAYVHGSSSNRRPSRQLESYTGSAQLRFALTRLLSAYGQYLYYHYQLAEGALLLRDIPSELGRHSVRVGVSASVPLLR